MILEGGGEGRRLNILDFVPGSKYTCIVKYEGSETEREKMNFKVQHCFLACRWVINRTERRPTGWKP